MMSSFHGVNGKRNDADSRLFSLSLFFLNLLYFDDGFTMLRVMSSLFASLSLINPQTSPPLDGFLVRSFLPQTSSSSFLRLRLLFLIPDSPSIRYLLFSEFLSLSLHVCISSPETAFIVSPSGGNTSSLSHLLSSIESSFLLGLPSHSRLENEIEYRKQRKRRRVLFLSHVCLSKNHETGLTE